MLREFGRPWRLALPAAVDGAHSWAEEIRVLSMEPLDDPGRDHPPPAPVPRDDDGGFDPLPPE